MICPGSVVTLSFSDIQPIGIVLASSLTGQLSQFAWHRNQSLVLWTTDHKVGQKIIYDNTGLRIIMDNKS
jgi:hypothetical protein